MGNCRRRRVVRMVHPRSNQMNLRTLSHLFASAASAFAASTLLVAAGPAAQLQYPEGAKIPRSMMPEEAAYVAANPLSNKHRATAPPTGDIWCPPEYAPMDGILMAWEGGNSFTTVLANMAKEITTVGNADVHIMVDSNSERSSAQSKLSSNGVNMSRVVFHVVNTDTIWIRDYGPRYIYQGDVRSIVDHTYNRPRPNDNKLPTYFGGELGHELYEIPLTHGGGNYHLNGVDIGFTTRLINNENNHLTEQEIHDLWMDYQNLDTQFYTPLPASVDSTQHIDMWMQVISDTEVIVSDWPAQSGSTQDNRCDNAAASLQADGYTVYRTPARLHNGTHYTYTNVVMCNDIVLIPRYSNGTITQYNSQALAAWQAAMPNKTIIQIDAQAVVTSAGVLHCIVMHLPAHLGGVNPTAHMLTPNGGESFGAGDQVEVKWLSDDDEGAVSAELQLSTDGGQTWPTTIATGLPAAGTYNWTVPSVTTSSARLRVIVSDGSGNTGDDASDADFSIGGASAGLFPYGTGKAGTLGVPSLSSQTLPVVGSNVTLDVDNALPNGTAKLIRGFATDSQPFDFAVVLVDYDTVYDLSINASGHAEFSGTVPSSSNLAGLSVYWQAWIPNDPAAFGQGWACSNGLETRLGY